MVSIFPPFLKFGNLNFPFSSGCLEVHVPHFDGLESFVFKFYGKVTSLPRLAYKVSCRSIFCKPFGMPTELH
jgi:hypothetical protein